ncbi:MAG: response regulator transcription factor [Ruminococcaceae bacterium]|nr:response regulator transcription factor [Oscillospiraceae bacterium]
MPYRVLIVDDQRMARQLFESVIEGAEWYELAGSLESAEEAAEFCASTQVDLVLMDLIFVNNLAGFDAARAVKKVSPRTKIVIVTSMPEVSYLERAREIGVESFWYKEVGEQPLLALMDRTMAGESVYPDTTPRLLLGNVSSAALTDRELEVLRELLTGATNSEIAEKLCMSERTVKTHITHMLEKTGFKNRTVLAINARISGLVIDG